jgi:hypothetical protein
MDKVIICAAVSFTVELDGDGEWIEVDAVHNAAVLAMPEGFTLERIIEWETDNGSD